MEVLLCFYDFDTGMVTNDFSCLLELFYTAHVQTDRRIKLKCTATGRRLRISKHNTNFFTELVDKDYNTV